MTKLLHQYHHYQYFAVDTLSQRQPLKNFTKQLKHLGCVFGLDFPFKPVNLVHIVRFMVPCGRGGGQQGGIRGRIEELNRKQKNDLFVFQQKTESMISFSLSAHPCINEVLTLH